MCGEKREIVAQPEVKEGSPPRVRGKDRPFKNCVKSPGITPACAGKRTPPRFTAAAEWDHPRVCGEKVITVVGAALLMGSPPRVRGKAKK